MLVMKPDGSTISNFWIVGPRNTHYSDASTLSSALSPYTGEMLFSQPFGLRSKLITLLLDRYGWIRVSNITRSLTSKGCVIDSTILIQDINTETDFRLQLSTFRPLKTHLSPRHSLLSITLRRSWILN
jgi:hypothetical protein